MYNAILAIADVVKLLAKRVEQDPELSAALASVDEALQHLKGQMGKFQTLVDRFLGDKHGS